MTEEDWLDCDDLVRLGELTCPACRPLPNRVPITRRMGTLFAAACVDATPQAVGDAFLQQVRDAVERAADTGQWAAIVGVEREAGERCTGVELESAAHYWALAALRLTSDAIEYHPFHVPHFLLRALQGSDSTPLLRQAYADRFRDVVGNPWHGGRGRWSNRRAKARRQAAVSSEHLTPTVVGLARQMYASQDFSPMPILADALQDAGCSNGDILDHCRGPGPHVRGCWAIDLLLGKE